MNLDGSQPRLSLVNLCVAAINSTLKWKKTLEFVGAEFDDLKGVYVAVKKDLKALGERFNFLSAPVNEMAIEIDNTVAALM